MPGSGPRLWNHGRVRPSLNRAGPTTTDATAAIRHAATGGTKRPGCERLHKGGRPGHERPRHALAARLDPVGQLDVHERACAQHRHELTQAARQLAAGGVDRGQTGELEPVAPLAPAQIAFESSTQSRSGSPPARSTVAARSPQKSSDRGEPDSSSSGAVDSATTAVITIGPRFGP